MIHVTADIGDRPVTFNHSAAHGWDHDDLGNLDLSNTRGDVIASYRANIWLRVWEDAEPADEPAPTEAPTAAHGELYWRDGSPDL